MSSEFQVNGYEDTQPLRDATQHLGDFAKLSKLLKEEGYLLLRGVVDLDGVSRLRQDILEVLRAHHILENNDASQPLWSGGPHPTDSEFMAFYDVVSQLESLEELARSPQISELMEGLFKGPVQVWEQLVCRMIFPDPEGQAPMGLAGHQDANPKFGYMVSDFYTCWLPLMEIDGKMGGLTLVPGSHQRGVLEHPGTLASSMEEARKREAGLAAQEFEWAATEYHPGDIVVFTSLTVHRGLPNRSNRIRLSCDFRYQPKGAWANWLARTSAPDCRRVGQEIDAIVNSRALYVTTGASGEILEEIRRRMMQEKKATLVRAQQLVAQIREEEKIKN